VLVDKQVVLTHQRLGAKPVTAYIKIDLNNTFHEIEMIAENLGSIPPNTAILIITAGANRHLLSLSSTESKSARVRIVYDEDVNRAEQTVALNPPPKN
jgi:fructose-1,6-bisphosphatase/sedoheptulose 1,7-bisphosphatase-like protein